MAITDFNKINKAAKLYDKLGTKAAVAKAMGISERTVGRLLEEKAAIKTNHVARYESPMSEDAGKYKPDWTAQDCIDELRRIAQIDTEKVITRNYFRNHSQISESTWQKYFGSFLEYKRQAGIILTRQQHALERQIAKHASIDHYRAANAERRSYAEKYIKPSKGRYKTVVVCSDLHDKHCDPFYLEVLIDTCKRIQPDIIVFNGDVFDLAEFGRYAVDPREYDVVGAINFVHENIFAPIREVCPNSQIDFISGNHEERLVKHLTDQTQAMKVLLSDLHGFTVAKLLGLDRFQINYIAKSDLSAYNKGDINKEVAKNYKVYYDSFICHHFPEGKNLGYPGTNGHHHKVHVETKYNELFGSYQWVQTGGGHRKDAEYCQGTKWSLGFLVVHVDTETRSTVFEPITFDDFAVVGGKYYTRKS